MSKSKVTAQVAEFAKPIVEEMNLELVDVEYVKEGANWYLRIYIDKEGGVDLDDCQAVSQRLDSILDEKDPIPQSYILEVSSPGIERPLKKPDDYRRFAGKKVAISTYEPLNGRKKFTAKLLGFDQTGVQLELDNQQVTIPMEKIASAKLVVEF
ncbi:ribosome maturation factor RimP [Desulfofalx alkaliphila]|uniref:ribosome maturation factor RimP n=1 Tax=Desulfofalx alkaliphila TaxID=105483 RepID=UPI0004E22BA0|nr:ribosome maturation factor RimP [Desulfofalx alkaliphila]